MVEKIDDVNTQETLAQLHAVFFEKFRPDQAGVIKFEGIELLNFEFLMKQIKK